MTKYLYKYFTNKEHLDSFLAGEVRFSSIATYKHMEENGTISDNDEAETSKTFKSSQIKSLKVTNENGDVLELKDHIESFTIGNKVTNYSHFFIFCSSHEDVSNNFRTENPEYKYYAKFELDDFNQKFDDYFKLDSPTNKNMDTSKRPYCTIEFNNLNFVIIFNGSYYEHNKVEYNEANIENDSKNLLFCKKSRFSYQSEYRHVFLLDYFKLNNVNNIYSEINDYLSYITNNKITTKYEDIEFIKKLNIIIRIKPNVIESGQLT